MNSLTVLLLALPALALLLLVLAMAIVLRRAWRGRAEARQVARVAGLRPLLLDVLAAREVDERVVSGLDRLDELDQRTWHAVEPGLVRLLGKVRGPGRDALAELMTRRGVVARAHRQAASRSAVRRCVAADVLGTIRPAGATDSLSRLLVDRDPEVRRVAARALGGLLYPAAATALLASLSGPRAVPARVVSSSLARLGPRAQPALLEALGASDPGIRAVAAEILGLVSSGGAGDALAATVRADPAVEVRIRAARALGRLGSPGGTTALVEACSPGNPGPLRAVAARALGDAGQAEAVPALRGLMSDPEHHVARNAAESLARCGPRGLAALERAAAGDDSSAAGEHAAATLTQVRAPTRHKPSAATLSRRA